MYQGDIGAQVISVKGTQGVAVDGYVVGTIITGDHNHVHQTIVRHYPALKDYAIDFGDLIESTSSRFVGRKDLFEQLRQFPKQHSCGYFRVVADAGLGKTAVAAEAAKRFEAPAFFANTSRGLTRSDQCLNHLSVELIARHGLAYDHLPARAGEDSAFLSKVLTEAAAKSTDPLWLVVDALDEAGSAGPGRNPLFLPDRLPRNVYILLTQRPPDILIATDAGPKIKDFRIASCDSGQQEDILNFLRKKAKNPKIRRALKFANPPISVDQFALFLQRKSEGNFKYLDYVLAGIESGEPGLDPLDLKTLPNGLRGYYGQFWSHIKEASDREGWADWDGLYRPVIASLAAAREPVPTSWLAYLVGRSAVEIEERALGRWRRVLSQERDGDTVRWRVVHQSFVDFLVEERKVDLRATHNHVASFYLSAWGGLDEGLPALFETSRRVAEAEDQYGLRHLAEHLEAAGRVDDLHRLMRLERRGDDAINGPSRAQNVWYTVRDRVGGTEGYMNDLARAARLVEVTNRTDMETGRIKTCIGLRVRYALMSTSLTSLARNIPPSFITTLIEKGKWLDSQGLAYARLLPSEKKAEALIAISSHLGIPEKQKALREALEASQAIEKNKRSEVLAKLAPRLADSGLPDEALKVAHEIKCERARCLAMGELGRVEEALALARKIGCEDDRNAAIVELAPRLADAGRLDEALAIARGIEYENYRTAALATLVPRLADAGRIDEALELAMGMSDNYTIWERMTGGSSRLSETLGALVNRLAKSGRINEARDVARGIGDERARCRILADLGHGEEALAVAREIDGVWTRSQILAELGRVHEALDIASGIDRAWSRLRALVKEGQFDEALAAALEIGYQRDRYAALAALVPRLADAGRIDEALAIARGIDRDNDRYAALAALVPRLDKLGRYEESWDVHSTINSDWLQSHAMSNWEWREKATDRELSTVEPWARDHALEALAPRLAKAGRADEALDLARGIGDPEIRSRILAELRRDDEALAAAREVTYIESRFRTLADLGRFDEALALVRIGDEDDRLKALAKLGDVDEALAAARRIQAWDRDEALAALVPRLAQASRVDEALALARGIGRKEIRDGALQVLTPALARLGRVDEALAVAYEVDNEVYRSVALARLGRFDEALGVARKLSDHGSRYSANRSELLGALVCHMVKQGRFDEARDVAREIGDELWRPEALADLGRIDEALALARRIDNERDRNLALTWLAPRLAELGRGEELLEWARGIAHAENRAQALAELGRVDEALAEASKFSYKEDRSRTLSALAPHLAALPRARAFLFWAKTLGLSATLGRAEFLADLKALAPLITVLGGPEAIEETCRAIEDVGRWWP